MPSAPFLIACGEAAGPVPPAEHIGAKAHNLARMAALGLPVPPALVLPADWCAAPETLSPTVWQPSLASLEKATGRRFGDLRHPLLLSVRSGAAASMPGMMETLLNVGLCDRTLPGFVRVTGNPRLAWDAYRRLVAGFGETVMGIEAAAFESDLRTVAGSAGEAGLDYAELRQLTRLHLLTVQRVTGQSFPQEPQEQLRRAIGAVFASWNAPKARAYRRLHGLSDEMGTAVTVQAMVFGNAGGTSGSGVGFTRHPSTGEPEPWVDFLFRAQGEDVVSGRRTAQGHAVLAQVAPALWAELLRHRLSLERAFRDMQDFEFTVEDGRLWLLQTRAGKRSAQARARIALDLCDEGVIDADEALRRTQDLDAETLSVERLAAEGSDTEALRLGQAAAASHGVASGEIVLDEEAARRRQAAGVPVLLLRRDAETADIAALDIAAGLLTTRGARTSHAAVVARQLGKVCLVGCGTMAIDLASRCVHFGSQVLHEGELLTLDGHEGAVYRGLLHTRREAPQELLERLDRLRRGHG